MTLPDSLTVSLGRQNYTFFSGKTIEPTRPMPLGRERSPLAVEERVEAGVEAAAQGQLELI